METIVFAILLIAGVLCLFGCSAFISHFFGLDNFYNENLKEQDIRNIPDKQIIDQDKFPD